MSQITAGNNEIEVVFPKFTNWRLLLLVSLFSVLLFQSIIHFNPYNLTWLRDGSFSWRNVLYFMLIDQILVELITVSIIVTGLSFYASYFNLERVLLRPVAIVQYFFSYLPFCLLIYFAFAPLTTGIRYLMHQFPSYESAIYWKNYFFVNTAVYLVYLLPSMLITYGLLIRGIVLGTYTITSNQGNLDALVSKHKMLLVKNQEGEKYISTSALSIISRRDRKTYLESLNGDQYTTNLTLSNLEELLPKTFFIRINRSTILAIPLIQTFAYWENQKYILKTKRGNEFVVSRNRMKQIKERLANAL